MASTKAKVIADTLAAYKRGEFQFLVGCDLFLEGFDEPSIACVVVARPTQSRARYCQMIGRGTRLFPGKSDVLVLDFVGNSGKHHLVGPVDLLGTQLDDRVREAAERRIEAGEQVVGAIDQARAEIDAEDARRRELAVEDERRKPIQAQATSEIEDVTNEGFEFFGFKLASARRNGHPVHPLRPRPPLLQWRMQ